MISSSGAVQKSFDLKLEAKQTQSIDILILNDLHLHLATFKKLLSTVELQISEKKRSQRFLPNRNTYLRNSYYLLCDWGLSKYPYQYYTSKI